MSNRIVMIGVFVGLCVSTASLAVGSWAYVPQEVRMAEAQLVVHGKIAGLTDSVNKNGTEYEVGIIEPIQVLKGKAPEVIKLAWYKPKPGAPTLSTQLPIPKQGEESIWVLMADEKLPVYWATYPTDRQPASQLNEVKRRLKTVESLKWSKPVHGAQLAVFVESRDLRDSNVRVNGKVVKALEQLSCYPLLRNVSDETIQWCNYPYDSQFSVDFRGPDGEPIEVKTGITNPRKPPLQARHFVPADPAQVKMMGYGYQLGHVTQPGDYILEMTYANDRGGKPVGVKNAWTGKVTTPPVRISVPKVVADKK